MKQTCHKAVAVSIVASQQKSETREEDKLMKANTLAVLALVFAGHAAVAGNLVEPIMETEVIQEETTASSGGFLVPLILLAVLVAAVSSGGSTPPRPD